MQFRLFVYGTLREYENAWKDNVVINATMVDTKYGFPAVTELNTENEVVGDVILVDSVRLAELDLYEGVPSLYTREMINIPGIGHCYIYVYSELSKEELPEDIEHIREWGIYDYEITEEGLCC